MPTRCSQSCQLSLEATSVLSKMDLNKRATSMKIGLMKAQTLVTHLGAWSLGQGSLQYKLTRAVSQAIKHGLLNPGIRLPSERSFAQALCVSRTTVVAVYD